MPVVVHAEDVGEQGGSQVEKGGHDGCTAQGMGARQDRQCEYLCCLLANQIGSYDVHLNMLEV